MKRFAVVLASVIVAFPACAADFTGTMLYSACTASDPESRQICGMWISGFTAGVFYSQALARHKHMMPASRLPDGVTGSQAQLIIEKFMLEHPEHLHEAAEANAIGAFEGAFPCKPSN